MTVPEQQFHTTSTSAFVTPVPIVLPLGLRAVLLITETMVGGGMVLCYSPDFHPAELLQDGKSNYSSGDGDQDSEPEGERHGGPAPEVMLSFGFDDSTVEDPGKPEFLLLHCGSRPLERDVP